VRARVRLLLLRDGHGRDRIEHAVLEVRPLLPDDVPAAAAVAEAALPDPLADDDAPWRLDWLRRRIGHLRATDPGGAWVAAGEDGEVVGVALALVRDRIWGLSLMAVHPALHARGIGTRLLRAALGHWDPDEVKGGIILSSTDPRAMRMYARAGFDLRPTVSLGGIVDRTAIPSGLRARPTDDVEAMAALGRPVRGGAYGPDDLAMLLSRPRAGAFAIEGRGFAVHVDGRPVVLCADTGGVGADILWSCLAAGRPGVTINVDYLTAGQDWAVRACLEAGLQITPDGPVFTRGELGPLRAWIPSGSLL